MSQVSNYGMVTSFMDGDQVSFELRSTEPLVQYIKKGTTGCMPDWSTSGRQPVVYPNAMSQLAAKRKEIIAGTEVWTYNDATISFNASGISVTPQVIDGKFQKVTYHNGDFNVPGLKFIGNLATPSNVNTDRIGMNCQVELAGYRVPVSNTIPVRLEETVGDPYQGLITATEGGVIDDNTSSITLTAELMKGGGIVSAGVTYKWTKAILGGWEAITSIPGTPDKITRTAADIDTYSIVRCEFWVDGMMVFAATKTISDETDPMVLVMNPDGSTVLPQNGSVTYTPKVVKRSTGVADTSYTKLSFTTYNASGSVITLPAAQIVANKSLKVTYSDVEKASGQVKVFVVASK